MTAPPGGVSARTDSTTEAPDESTSPDLPSGTVIMVAASVLEDSALRHLNDDLQRLGRMHAVQRQRVQVRESSTVSEIDVVRWSVTPDDDVAPSAGQALANVLATFAATVREGGDQVPQPVSATLVPASKRPAAEAMLLLDVDSTLIDQEVIELLARHAGREAEVAAVTDQAMAGKLDFAASLHHRVAALAGLPLGVIDSTVRAVTPTQGAETLIAGFRRRGWPVCAVSGGFNQVLDPLAERLGLTSSEANELAVDHDSDTLAGTVHGAVVDRAAKADHLRRWAGEHGVAPESVVAIGDGANDLDMVTAAGLGVAFCPKPALAERADLVIEHRSLELVLLALGLD